jgi:hypothetical protein
MIPALEFPLNCHKKWPSRQPDHVHTRLPPTFRGMSSAMREAGLDDYVPELSGSCYRPRRLVGCSTWRQVQGEHSPLCKTRRKSRL